MNGLPTVGFIGNHDGSIGRAGTFEVLIELIGENTGNLMFQHACWKQIVNPKIAFRLGYDLDLDTFKNNIDVLCIPAANQLNPDWDLESWAELVEFVDKPVIIAGLGAQAKIGEVSAIELRPGTLRLLKLLSERAVFIGVRGDSTLRLLAKYGVANGIITGCPSNFITSELNGKDISQKIAAAESITSPKINYVFGTMEDYARDFESVLFKLWNGNRGSLIYQTSVGTLRYLFDGSMTDAVRSDFDWQNRRLKTSLSTDQYIELIGARGRFFTDAAKWIAASKQCDLTIGMRIHGAIAAIQARSLGVCVAFDSRTLELVQTMSYPYLLGEDLAHLRHLADLYQAIRFNSQSFDREREVLRVNLKRALEQHGVVTRL